MTSNPLIFSGSAHSAFVDALMKADSSLRPTGEDVPFQRGECLVGRFSDGETQIEIQTSVRGRDVFLVQPTCPPNTDGALMELCIMIDACKRASAQRITAVIPYFGYARQDRKVAARAPISAALVARFIEAAGADRVLTMDLHSPAIQGFFGIPVDNLYGQSVLEHPLTLAVVGGRQRQGREDWTVVAPDAGATKLAELHAKRLGNLPVAFVSKTRPRPNEVKITRVIGDVEGRNCILVDDMIDTAGTIVGAARALKAQGAGSILVAATHGLFTGPAQTRLAETPIERLIVLDTVPVDPGMTYGNVVTGDNSTEETLQKLEVVSAAPLFTRAIRRLHAGRSVSELFHS